MDKKLAYEELERQIKKLEAKIAEQAWADQALGQTESRFRLILTNITERKQVEAALQKAHDKLEMRVQEQTSELEKVNEQIKQEIVVRKQTEETLRESEEKYRLLANNLPGAIYKGFKDWSIEFIDDKSSVLTGYDVGEFNSRKMKWSDIIVKEDLETARKVFKQALKTDKSYMREYRIKSKAGDIHWIQERSQIVCDNKGMIEYVSGIFFDISDSKQAEQKRSELEAQLLHVQKMEAIGTLAGGIAHDFNNILQAIFGYVQILMLEKEESDPDYEKLAEIQKAVQRVKELTDQLLIFGRKVEIKLRPVDLNHEIKLVSKLLERTIPKMINIVLKLSDNLKIINADPIQLEQIIINLGINARDAMPDGGKLIIETKNVILDELYCKSHLGSVPGEYVLLAISDTGHGMEKEIREHIFEPFFTTKEIGKGTGLGMAVVYGIVKSLGGYITCYSEPGQGATFKIYLPALQYQEVEIAAEKKEKMPGGNETILLVDDDKTLLDLGSQIFGRHGYTVTTAECGEEAVEIYKAQKNRLDLVILDVGMPGMGGHKCLQELLKIDPHVKVIIASGYAVTRKLQKTLESGAAGFLAKPFNMVDALKKIREILDQGSPSSSSSCHIEDK